MPLYRIGGIWYLDLSSKRGRLRRSTGTSDKRQAQAYLERVRNEIWEQERLGKPPAVSWGEAVRKWVEVKNPGLPDRYRIRALDLAPSSEMPFSSSAIQECLSSTGMAAGSWNRTVSLIATIHKLSGLLPDLYQRKPPPPSRTRWLNKREAGRLIAVLEKYSPLLRQAAQFTLATGLRENNVLELRWDQVDLKRKRLFIEAGQVKNRTAIGIPLNDDALRVLRERRGLDAKWVFSNAWSGKPLVKASNKAWYKALKEAKLVGFRWHDLRHTFASWAVMNGVSLIELQQLGGWKSIQMVQRYAHLAPDHLAQAANRIKPV